MLNLKKWFKKDQPEPSLTWDPQATQALEMALQQAPVPAMLKGRVRRLEEVSSDIISLEQTVRGQQDDDSAQLQELLEDNDAPIPQQVAQQELVRGIVLSAVETLPSREKKILELRFGLGNKQPHTLEDIGSLFGISRERVRQLQNSALRRLRERQSVTRAYV